MELLGVVSIGMVLTVASGRLWTGLGHSQIVSTQQAALSLKSALDEAMLTSRGLGSPVAVVCAEAQSEGGVPETQILLLRALQTTEADIAVGWPMQLGAEQRWRQEGEARHLTRIRLATTGGEFSRSELSWRVISIATPSGVWATGPASTSTWAGIEDVSTVRISSQGGKKSLPGTNVILHPASSRPFIETDR